MKRSTDRILTSHTGSLHRSEDFEAAATRHFGPSGDDNTQWDALLSSEVESVVGKQRELGVDVVNDGEYSKSNWLYYVADRLAGFGDASVQPPSLSGGLGGATDIANFPTFYRDAAELDGVSIWRRHSESFFPDPEAPLKIQACIGPVTYKGKESLARDIANLKAGLAAVGAEPSDGFIGVAAPGTFGLLHVDEHYGDREAYFFALADAIGEECRAIAAAGLNVQIDDPMLPSIHDMLELDRQQTRELGELVVAATNRALEGVPEEQVRHHICWGSWNSPHASDIELEDVIHLVYQVKAQTYSVEAANVRHDHEWRVFEKSKLPAGKILMPGVVSHATNVIEHPRGVADRIVRFAGVVGRENVIAGSDCGFRARSHPEVAWAKLRSLSEGAALATKDLWP
ncbi:MAG: epoxyalkane--coenzyme M transferase [Streptosporangiales bacterium]|nr:epoxyalkane--coenzyme M transferase [Streptosporangiales bacterium]